MRRWIDPLLLGAAFALVAWRVTLVETPRAIMHQAIERVAEGGLNRFVQEGADPSVAQDPALGTSACAFDLLKGPLLVELPPLPAAFASLIVIDSTAHPVADRDVARSGAPLRFVIAIAGQRVPAGGAVVRIGSRRGIVLLQALAGTGRPSATVDAARRAATCRRI